MRARLQESAEPALLFAGDFLSLPAALWARRPQDRVACLWQGEYDFDNDSCLRKWVQHGANRADLLLASEPVAAHLNSLDGLVSQVRVLNPKIETEELFGVAREGPALRAREALGLPVEGKVALCVGRIGEGKGQWWLLKRFVESEELRREWNLCFAGPVAQEEKSVWEALVQRAGGRCLWLGPSDDVPQLMAAADCLLFPGTFSESFGMTMLEAALTQAPMLCYPVGALPYVLGENFKGFVCPIGDEQAFVQAWQNIDHRECEPEAYAKALRDRFGPTSWKESLARVLRLAGDSATRD